MFNPYSKRLVGTSGPVDRGDRFGGGRGPESFQPGPLPDFLSAMGEVPQGFDPPGPMGPAADTSTPGPFGYNPYLANYDPRSMTGLFNAGAEQMAGRFVIEYAPFGQFSTQVRQPGQEGYSEGLFSFAPEQMSFFQNAGNHRGFVGHSGMPANLVMQSGSYDDTERMYNYDGSPRRRKPERRPRTSTTANEGLQG